VNPARLAAFIDAYAPALITVLGPGPHPLAKDESVEDYALSTAAAMCERLELYGVDSIAHYWLNIRAFRATCKALGIQCSSRSIENYLEGK
jgi:hypothetical protein